MNNERLEHLLQFLKEDPNDPFNIYCLANEYKNNDPEKAMAYYQELLQDHPKYLATYYHAAELYININDIEKAEKVITDGVALAIEQGDQLALRELRNLQNNLFDY
jgi:tetratricopeptide (TPR) repeat protein